MIVFLLAQIGLVCSWNSRLDSELGVVVDGAKTLTWAEVVCKVGAGSQTCANLLLVAVLLHLRLLARILPLLLRVVVVLSFLTVLLGGHSGYSVTLVYYTSVIGGILG
jgi:hypothetical protein